MEDWEAKILAAYGGEPPWGPSDENRPNEDRPLLVRPKKENSEFYNYIFHGKPINYRRWYNDRLRWRILPPEEKHRSCSRRQALETGVFRTLLVEVYGEQGYQIMDAVYASFARDDYIRGRARGLIKDPDKMGPIEVASYIATIYDIEGLFPFVVAEASGKRARTQAYFDGQELCNYGCRKGDFRFCVNTGGWERELAKLMNPKLRARLTKSRLCGDYCCELTFDWDTGEYEEEVKERPASPVRPELVHSEIYKYVMHGTPNDTSLWTNPISYRRLPWELKHIACSRRFGAETGYMRTMIGELFGEEGYQLIEKAYASLATVEYQIGRDRGLIKNPDKVGPLDVAKYICFLYDVCGRTPIVIAESSDERVRIQHFHGLPATCHYLARQGDWKMCVAEAAFERDLTKLMNPKLRARRTKGKIYGDYCCELTIDRDSEAK